MERKGRSYYYRNRVNDLTLCGRDLRTTFGQESQRFSHSMRFFEGNILKNLNETNPEQDQNKKEKIIKEDFRRNLAGKRVFHLLQKANLDDIATQESSDDEGSNIFQNEYLRSKIRNAPSIDSKTFQERKRVQTETGQSVRKRKDIFSITPEEKSKFLTKYLKEQKFLITKTCFGENRTESQMKKHKHMLISFAH